ncbi:tetratricopeptide repeat protein [Cryptosporangium aurantiacum]|uniref:Tetratricopeptide repeat-containing protein n=1 Tax=Cryptosporangium aurantiacum TaxID=134849 RepID=A0A1M7GYA5_9ACTN|nr:tetratricopeptide repeat protein [Cryptosporangium aurantiacum]SHM21364.1 Tetratricopeptide repeat-containing protein [Cryptosporangium aurantiacum]
MPRIRRLALAALPVAVGLTLASAVLLPNSNDGDARERATARTATVVAPKDCASDGCIAALQAWLRTHPKDGQAWSTLAVAYVDRARVTGRTEWYPRAQSALDKALALAPNDDAALSAAGILAAARHEFAAALRWGDRAAAANPYSARAQIVRADALVELGRYPQARDAATAADNLEPGVPTFTRLSYLDELAGRTDRAAALLRRGVEPGNTPADIAFGRFHLGELARNTGNHAAAAVEYEAALAADPEHLAARAGLARVEVARGNLPGAIGIYRAIVRQMPLPQYAAELGELLEATGDRAGAAQQYAVVRASIALSRSAGVVDGPEITVFEADHGSPAEAVRLGQAEWKTRQSIHVADALGWALFRAGRAADALPYVRAATRLGTKDARLLYHRGMVERAAGLPADARRSLGRALALDPHFSALEGPRARAALAGLR